MHLDSPATRIGMPLGGAGNQSRVRRRGSSVFSRGTLHHRAGGHLFLHSLLHVHHLTFHLHHAVAHRPPLVGKSRQQGRHGSDLCLACCLVHGGDERLQPVVAGLHHVRPHHLLLSGRGLRWCGGGVVVL